MGCMPWLKSYVVRAYTYHYYCWIDVKYFASPNRVALFLSCKCACVKVVDATEGY